MPVQGVRVPDEAQLPTALRDDPKPSSSAAPVSGVELPVGAAAPRTAAPPRRGCPHSPPCPAADGADRDAARVTRQHWDQGWSLLCNGVILFEDTGEILPTGRTVEPRRALPRPAPVPRPPAPRRGSGQPAVTV
ncbi:DUF5999 family protein [Frankia sp. AgB32]|uniref:DUF5999 family protein n=1 Tax=Frankia sp. AgB32 TaxID=631119 RepID=UPI00200FE3B5|nr:DUF5999 family protein [Frankia sp. AgB32]MCK9894086.1 DUF5999 family protein [Frankia sp. AgB32]